jgi:hypothetical protein
MATIFNTNRSTKTSGAIASSEYAKITLGGQVTLAQSVQGNYTRKVQTIFEIGNPNIYWIGGHEEGTLQVQRLVGDSGFYATIDPGACGEITPVSIDVSGGDCAKGAGGLTISDAVLEGVSFSMSAGNLEITEGVNIKFASLSRS